MTALIQLQEENMKKRRIEKKFWISPEGEAIELPRGGEHSLYAMGYFKEKKIDVPFGEVLKRFLNDGWIRVQVGIDDVGDSYVALEGKESKVSDYGNLVYSFKPDFKWLFFHIVDTEKSKDIPREKIEGWSWGSVIEEVRKE